MMYIKLVLRSARRSLSDYALYLVTMTICVTLFYAFLSLSSRYYHPFADSDTAHDCSTMPYPYIIFNNRYAIVPS